MNWSDIRTELKELSLDNEEYAKFNKRIVNTQQNMLGVRMPDMRKLAKRLSREMTANKISEMLDTLDKSAFEEVLLTGLVIDYVKIPDVERIDLIRRYLKLVDCWGQIDTVAMTMKKFNIDLWWKFVLECLKSKDEFVVRYGIIFAMCNFLTDEKIEQVFKTLTTIKHDGYYVKMGIAWLYATSAVKYYKQTLVEVNRFDLDPWTCKKALTKMLESYRFTDEQKAQIRELRARIIV